MSAEQTYFANLRTGRKRAIASTQNDVGVAPPPPDTRALKTFGTAGGRAVATILAPGATVRVVALGARGSLRTLAVANRAELPPESLTLVGATVSWVQSGEPVRARLP